MRFKFWVENDQAPASAEVIRSGLQPQVDSQEIKTQQKDDSDKIMAIDSHLQRIAAILPSLKTNESGKMEKVAQFIRETMRTWNQIKDESASVISPPDPWSFNQAKVDWMKDNQPLPEEPRISDHPTAF